MRFLIAVPLVFWFAVCWAEENDPRVREFYQRAVQVARNSVGMTRVPSVDGKKFASDCIGFIRYVYYKAGFDLVQAYGQGRGGVSSLYDGLAERKYVYSAKYAPPGDLIFFDNTYDVNRNGIWDDPLSHIGIISGSGRHGTLFYVHFGNKGVEERRINVVYPNTHAFRQKDGKLYEINSYLRRNRGEGYEKKEYVASSFYRAFAHIKFKVKD